MCGVCVCEGVCEVSAKDLWSDRQKEADFSVPQVELLDPGEPLEDNLLSVRKSAVGRTHSLPNDSYMFLPLEPFGPPGAGLAPGLSPVLTQSTGPQHIEALSSALSGSSTSVRSQPEESSQQSAVPTDIFRPISPHSLSDSENIPRLPPPQHTHTLSRTLRRQVAVSNDSQEALWSDGGEGVLNVASLALPLSSSSSSSSHLHQQPSLWLVPATPGASPQLSRPSSVHTQHPFSNHDQHHLSSSPNSPSSLSSPPPPLPSARPWRQEEASADHEVSLINRAGLAGSEDVGRGEGSRPCLRQLKRFHSADAQGRSILASRPRPLSWLDDPRRHSVEVCSSVESSPQRSTTSSGFVSRADSLQIHSQTTTKTLPSPRRKKKMSPPCISVDPPDGLESQPGLQPTLGGLGGLGMPPPLPSRDTSCLRRRAPSSDSKDSFDLGAGEGLGQEGGGPNPKLLTLPSFSFEKTSSEH
ncbi:unnamed protein product [Oncorhynchus mykiss]|uniref:Uncharacterized protein n=1 Tax=Oncorhynchus mykiss TaxID=8022 RepID=A0A060X420_ONCMY|nr:unnamed protein product [Oncorhynchus mykiss]